MSTRIPDAGVTAIFISREVIVAAEGIVIGS
jgi:hypothetical protein